MKKEIHRAGAVMGEFADIVVTPHRLANCAIKIGKVVKTLPGRGEREQLREDFLTIIKG